MVTAPEAVFSNDLRQLLEVLVEDIKISSTPSLLTASIVVPDGAIRAWLSHELSKKGVSLLRVEILLLEEALEHPASGTQRLTRFHLIPLLMSFLASPDGACLPLEGVSAQAHMARRLRLPFALRAFLGEKGWFSKEKDAELLWQKFEAWCPLTLPGKGQPYSSSGVPLFLFGFSSLNHCLLNQLLGSPSLQCLYLLSPCMLFWGDQSSDHEMRFLLSCTSNASRLPTEQFLNDRHRLLANCGQIGREFMLLVEETQLQTRSMYVLPQALVKPPYTDYLATGHIVRDNGPPTLLDHLKADLLLLVGKREAPEPLLRDRSIEIHGAPTPLREVEALLERLGGFASLPPASVIVLVTDMSRYQAAIEQALGRTIPYQIWGKTEKQSIITAFRMVLNLLQSKGTVPDWLQLLRHPVFHVALQMTKDEAEALIQWLSDRPIRWGVSQTQKKRYLASRAITPSTLNSTSFEQEREALLDSLVSTCSEDNVDVSLLKPVGNFFEFLGAIERWWQLPVQGSAFASMDSLATLFDTVLERLVQGSTGGFDEEALKVASAAFAQISLDTGSPVLLISEGIRLFYHLVDTHLSRHLLHLSKPVIVAEFGSFQPFPAQLIAVLGAHEGALPQHSEEQLLDRLDRMVPKIPASNTFFDRYAFLEAILQAENLFVTYQSYAFEVREQMPYSPVVADLFAHLDANYLIDSALPSSSLLFSHPLPPSVQYPFSHPSLTPSPPHEKSTILFS